MTRDVQAKSLELPTAESEVNVKSKALANLEAMSTLLADDVMELERHEQVMLDMQSSLNLHTWMNSS